MRRMQKIPMTHRPYEDFVHDKFGNNLKVTTTNLLSSILFFIVLLAPFVIIGLAMFYFHDERIIHYMKFLLIFFACWAIFFLFYVPILTVINNYRTEHLYHRRLHYYNSNVLDKRANWLHNYYRHKFGTGLHNKKIYTVAKYNNIPVDYIIKTYRKAMNRR